MKNLVVTDYALPEHVFNHSIIVDLNNCHYKTCTGGLTCYVTHGKCKYEDDFSLINDWLNNCSLIILITHVRYGCIDIPMKRFLERMISSDQPFYSEVEGETTHLSGSLLKKQIIVLSYGEQDVDEQLLLKDTINSYFLGTDTDAIHVYSVKDEKELHQAFITFGGVDHE